MKQQGDGPIVVSVPDATPKATAASPRTWPLERFHGVLNFHGTWSEPGCIELRVPTAQASYAAGEKFKVEDGSY